VAPPMSEYGISGESIVCFAGEDWWYHHPHSKNPKEAPAPNFDIQDLILIFFC
jgi:hypothetical protein